MADSRWDVALTGIGLVTPLGLDSSESVSKALRGESAAALLPESEGGIAAAMVPPFDLTPHLRTPKNLKLIGHSVRLAVLAMREAVAQSGFGGGFNESERVGVYVGSGQTGLEYDEFFKALAVAWENGKEQDFKYLGGMPARLLDRYFSLRTLANAGIAVISTEFGARGPSNNFVQGEIALALALQSACYDLMEGRADAVLVAAYDALVFPSQFMAFRTMGLLSGDGRGVAYRPFDRDREGIVLGEGAACFVLERGADAKARKAAILAKIHGIGLTSQTSDESSLGAGVEEISRAAGEAAPDARVDFVFARGFGTQHEDALEASALDRFVPAGAYVSAVKGQTGYLGAAGAGVELGLGLLSARMGYVPPVGGLVQPDAGVTLPFVRSNAAEIERPNPHGLFLACSFGGQVAAIAAQAIRN